MSPQTHSDDIEYATVEIDGRPVRVRTTPPPARRREPALVGTLASARPRHRAPARPRRALPPTYTLTPARPRSARPERAPASTEPFIEKLPGFAVVIAAAILLAGFVGLLAAG